MTDFHGTGPQSTGLHGTGSQSTGSHGTDSQWTGAHWTASRWAAATLLFALTILYSSTLIGPAGPHYVPIELQEAVSRFVSMPLARNGSDQRADWMGNLAMLVPLGFMTAAWFSPSRRHLVLAGVAAFAVCAGFVLAVKFAQLFFPPRTVTLNYVLAQIAGTAIGIVLRGVLGRHAEALTPSAGRMETLRAILRLYTGLAVLFFLTPLDFALNLEDLAIQLEKLPETFTAISGEGRPAVVRMVLALASIAMTIPIGALLTLRNERRLVVGRTVAAAIWIGFCWMILVFALTALVISGAASLPGVFLRVIGIALGAWGIHWFARQDPRKIRRGLAALVPWAVAAYLAAVAAVNGLISTDWIGPDAAAADFYRLGLYPLFNYYIVTKAQAAKNIAAHAVMYAPIGVFIWLRARDGGGKGAAFFLAAMLSAIVEGGRFLRPGLVPDINAIPLAGIAAWAALAAMPSVWNILSAISRDGGASHEPLQGGDGGPDWRDRDIIRRTRRRETAAPAGEVEEY